MRFFMTAMTILLAATAARADHEIRIKNGETKKIRVGFKDFRIACVGERDDRHVRADMKVPNNTSQSENLPILGTVTVSCYDPDDIARDHDGEGHGGRHDRDGGQNSNLGLLQVYDGGTFSYGGGTDRSGAKTVAVDFTNYQVSVSNNSATDVYQCNTMGRTCKLIAWIYQSKTYTNFTGTLSMDSNDGSSITETGGSNDHLLRVK